MKIGFLLIVFLFTIASAAPAQTTKFNNNGDLIRITGLLDDTTGCEPSKLYTGRIVSIEPLRGENADSFEFTVKPAAGKTSKFLATLSLDAGAVIVDLENMLQPKHRVKLKARLCGSGGFLTVEEITRL